MSVEKYGQTDTTENKSVPHNKEILAEHLHVPATKEKDRRAGRLNEVRAPTT